MLIVEYESIYLFLCKSFKKWLLTPRGHELLCPVWYPGEIDSAQYDTQGSLTLRSVIPRGDFYEKF